MWAHYCLCVYVYVIPSLLNKQDIVRVLRKLKNTRSRKQVTSADWAWLVCARQAMQQKKAKAFAPDFLVHYVTKSTVGRYWIKNNSIMYANNSKAYDKESMTNSILLHVFHAQTRLEEACRTAIAPELPWRSHTLNTFTRKTCKNPPHIQPQWRAHTRKMRAMTSIWKPPPICHWNQWLTPHTTITFTTITFTTITFTTITFTTITFTTITFTTKLHTHENCIGIQVQGAPPWGVWCVLICTSQRVADHDIQAIQHARQTPHIYKVGQNHIYTV